MEKRDVLKINRQFLLLTRQLAREGRAAEIMTGLPRAVIEKVASLTARGKQIGRAHV